MITNNIEDLLTNYGLQVESEQYTLSQDEVNLILEEEMETL